MKKILLCILYGILAALAFAGIASAVHLYPTHAANGTSAAYFTVILFPAALLLLGLTGAFFRYWWALEGGAWLVMAYVLIRDVNADLFVYGMLAVYLLLGLAAGITGTCLRRIRKAK